MYQIGYSQPPLTSSSLQIFFLAFGCFGSSSATGSDLTRAAAVSAILCICDSTRTGVSWRGEVGAPGWPQASPLPELGGEASSPGSTSSLSCFSSLSLSLSLSRSLRSPENSRARRRRELSRSFTRDWGEWGEGGRGGPVRERGGEWGEWEGRDLEGVRRGKEEVTVAGMSEGTEGTECAREVVRLAEVADSPPSRLEAWLWLWLWPWLPPSTPPPPLALMTAAALWKPIWVGTRGVWNKPGREK